MYGYFVYRKLKAAITVVSPALERLPDNPDVCETVFRILLAGDIALHINDDRLLQTMETVFANGLPDDKTLVQWARTNHESKKSILFTGEPWCMHNGLFQSIIVKQIQAAGFDTVFAPLSETVLFDLHKQRRSKTVKGLEELMYNAAQALGNNSPFSASLEQLTGGTAAGDFNGGFGNYRLAKTALYNEHILGVISVSSQYENTESVLELLSPGKKTPFLNLRFDGENNPVSRLKIEAFLDGVGKERI
ncbi:MAG: hypothetical protein LBD31_10095 [Treponema sp.]|nr:hypothetical protein [Treponema sp.]